MIDNDGVLISVKVFHKSAESTRRVDHDQVHLLVTGLARIDPELYPVRYRDYIDYWKRMNKDAGFWETLEQARGPLSEKTTDKPIPRNVETYDRLFEIYRSLYPRLIEVFDDLSTFQQIKFGSEG